MSDYKLRLPKEHVLPWYRSVGWWVQTVCAGILTWEVMPDGYPIRRVLCIVLISIALTGAQAHGERP